MGLGRARSLLSRRGGLMRMTKRLLVAKVVELSRLKRPRMNPMEMRLTPKVKAEKLNW
jgi:hypothetical protein